MVFHLQGRLEKAIQHYRYALAIDREIGDRRNESKTLGNLGTAYCSLGRVAEATQLFEQALEICRDLGDRRGEAFRALAFGKTLARQGSLAEAANFIASTVAYLEESGHPYAETHAQLLKTIQRMADESSQENSVAVDSAEESK